MVGLHGRSLDWRHGELRRYNEGRYGIGTAEDETGVWHFGVVLPDPGNPANVDYIFIATNLVGTVDAPVVVTVVWKDGNSLVNSWEPSKHTIDEAFAKKCWEQAAAKSIEAQIDLIGAIWGDAAGSVGAGGPVDQDPRQKAPVDNQQPGFRTGQPVVDHGKPPIDPEAPGGFGAGIEGLPSKPGWFKTPAGFCRKWEPWERAILKLAQDKNKREMESYLEKIGCAKPTKRCFTTTRYCV